MDRLHRKKVILDYELCCCLFVCLQSLQVSPVDQLKWSKRRTVSLWYAGSTIQSVSHFEQLGPSKEGSFLSPRALALCRKDLCSTTLPVLPLVTKAPTLVELLVPLEDGQPQWTSVCIVSCLGCSCIVTSVVNHPLSVIGTYIHVQLKCNLHTVNTKVWSKTSLV